jgi:hypothetical protein
MQFQIALSTESKPLIFKDLNFPIEKNYRKFFENCKHILIG